MKSLITSLLLFINIYFTIANENTIYLEIDDLLNIYPNKICKLNNYDNVKLGDDRFELIKLFNGCYQIGFNNISVIGINDIIYNPRNNYSTIFRFSDDEHNSITKKIIFSYNNKNSPTIRLIKYKEIYNNEKLNINYLTNNNYLPYVIILQSYIYSLDEINIGLDSFMNKNTAKWEIVQFDASNKFLIHDLQNTFYQEFDKIELNIWIKHKNSFYKSYNIMITKNDHTVYLDNFY
jgi:hypothetical protein